MPTVTAKALREERAKLTPQIRAMADKVNGEKRKFTSEELPIWEKLNADYDDLTRQIEIAERAERVEADEARANPPAPATPPPTPGREDRSHRRTRRREERESRTRPEVTEQHRALAVQAWCRHQEGFGISREHRAACRLVGLDPRTPSLPLTLAPRQPGSIQQARSWYNAEHRALSGIDAAAGGILVPGSMMNALEVAMLQFGGMLEVAQVMRTSDGADFVWPSVNDTGNTGAIMSENPSSQSEQDLSFGGVTFGAHQYTSKMIRVPVALLEDSAFDLATFLGEALGERLGRILNTHMTTGDGAAKPRGVVTGATLGVTAASATAFTADELYSLVHSVNPAYRTGASWMFHDNVLLVIRQLKDGNGQYLWQAGLQASEPDRILGYPYRVNQDMASSVAASAKTLLFGQLRKYKARLVRGIRLRRLVERYAELDQEGFVSFQRADGNLLDAGVAPVKYLQQAA